MTSGDEIVACARRWIGTPFAWGQSVRGAGCDCKGLVAGVARELGLPGADSFEAGFAGYAAHGRVPVDELKAGLEKLFDPAEHLLEGDVLLLRVAKRAQHLAIYAGGNRMIHTYSKGPERVIEVPMGSVWMRAIDSVWRWRASGRPTAPLHEGVNHGR